MSAQIQSDKQQPPPLPRYESILLAVDSSDHSTRGTLDAVELATLYNSRLTAAHVYAAKLHDMRFRQMEGGLPEQFREEDELERQRDVHDDLITRGLSIITDSYLDRVDDAAKKLGSPVRRRSLEGKNYRELVNEANGGEYDLLVMGALGLGAVKGSRLGTVCQRVSRRSKIDTLVIKNPNRPVDAGPVVVAIDGSTKAYGGLLTALSFAKAWGVELKVVSAFDPYYHYVAFNRIAGVLSAEAGKVFKFREQEKLHEEIIDSGLAKIYQGHLDVAQSIAGDYGVEIETLLLDGKPHEVIVRYLRDADPSLLVVGTTGIHADAELDIGGNTEYLLNDAPCTVLLSQRDHQPQLDRLASVTTSWTHAAEARMERVPSFVRNMARMAILRYAQEKGHTVITGSLVEEATAKLMPGRAEQAMGEIVEAYDRGELKSKPWEEEPIRWSDKAAKMLLTVTDLSLRGNLSIRAEKKARKDGANRVEAEHVRPFLEQDFDERSDMPATSGSTADRGTPETDAEVPSIKWQAAALARLMRVPEGFMRDSTRNRIEAYARDNGHTDITLEIAEAGLAQARETMAAMQSHGSIRTSEAENSTCPFASIGQSSTQAPEIADPDKPAWTPEAREMLVAVPVGFCRDMTVNAAESIARRNGVETVDERFFSQILETIKHGSEAVEQSMSWIPAAEERLRRVPDSVRGMLIKEIESWAARSGKQSIDLEVVDAVKAQWRRRGLFHLDPNDPRNG